MGLYYKACLFCELSNDTRNLSHKQFRAVAGQPPRKNHDMNYYGMGDGKVLGNLELDLPHAEHMWYEVCSGAGAKRAIRDTTLFRHGRFGDLHSNHAR